MDQPALFAVPAYFSGTLAGVLGAGHRFGGHDQQLFDKLARHLSKHVFDRELRLPDHREQRQCRLRVGANQWLGL